MHYFTEENIFIFLLQIFLLLGLARGLGELFRSWLWADMGYFQASPYSPQYRKEIMVDKYKKDGILTPVVNKGGKVIAVR